MERTPARDSRKARMTESCGEIANVPYAMQRLDVSLAAAEDNLPRAEGQRWRSKQGQRISNEPHKPERVCMCMYMLGGGRCTRGRASAGPGWQCSWTRKERYIDRQVHHWSESDVVGMLQMGDSWPRAAWTRIVKRGCETI